MRRLALFIICSLISLTAFSQNEGNYNYSIGVRGYSYIQMPKILHQTNSQSYTHTYLNGVMMKFNDNQISIRLNGNYFKKNIEFNNQCNTCEIAAGNVTDFALTVGFEKNLNYAIIQPYFGADMGFKANRFTGEVRSVNTTTALPYSVDADKNGFVLAPLLGLKVTPVKQITFFAETSLNFYYSYERQESIQQNPQNTRSFVKYNKWEFLLNPISVGVQIQLISRN